MNERSSRRRRLTRSEYAVLAFTGLYMAAALVACLWRQNIEFIFYIVVMGLLIGAAIAFHLRVRMPVAAMWGLSIWGVAHMAGGLVKIPESWPRLGDDNVLYNLWIIPQLLKYDHVVHAYGFGIMTWACWLGLRAAITSRGAQAAPSVGLLTLCVAGGMGFGAANEVVEFVATLVLPETNVGGYINNGWDLVANTAGSLIAAVLIYVWPASTSRG